jgi:hypothetical protein
MELSIKFVCSNEKRIKLCPFMIIVVLIAIQLTIYSTKVMKYWKMFFAPLVVLLIIGN